MQSLNKPLNAIVVCGPSGVGKGTLLGRLFRDYPNSFAYSVSHTTRQPRMGEVNGREYHFTDRSEIIKMRDNNEFLELCDVHGNFYGTSVAAVQDVQKQGKICVIEIDVKGAQKLYNRNDDALNCVYLFITAPKAELRKRILGRGADDEKMLQRRLETAEAEFKFLEEHPDFFAATIVNDVLDEAYGRLVDAVNEQLELHNMNTLSSGVKK
ncbi:putative Guanylate kinase [Leptomonas pyrrhocoris]|uniref:guanylate kinase n=1 Tax=Leptomonas pyrrhocoris TaxID=157538 RepID=A0A0N0VE26_LEPPY|nr:putative Guanylate kinase [Leptomonas pyrrhocoris]KPA76658.1 putative Guanylate kinase [Leptomonas pyrrhocoris]|eukprot:XP_015655097.1 putative Guanylate kinase [Leptomonas pyrrhocoris]